jgi:3-oxoacyl-[acyl-carrier-protein] synthase-3
MIGIKSIASYIPDATIDNFKQGEKFGETEDFILNKIGARYLPRKDVGQQASDLAKLAVEKLLDKCPDLKPDAIDALVVVTQNPDGEGLPHTAAILQYKLGLPTTVAAFDVSLGCSGYVYGLFILKGFLETAGLKNGVLVTCDPYSNVIDETDRVTSLLFGDAATATWMGAEPEWSLDDVEFNTDGAGADHLKVSNGTLHMNGRQIFSFAATKVEPQIRSILKRQNLSPDAIDMYVLHQGSAAIIDAISTSFGDISDKFVKYMMNTGNTVSSTIPIMLENRAFNRDLDKILICGFGVGLSMATAVISRSEKEANNA